MHTNFPARLRTAASRAKGLTLVEMMITMGIFSFVVIALVYTHIFGLRQSALVESKLGASDQSRRSFNQLSMEVRSAKRWRIGNGGANSFVRVPDGQIQQGNALEINLTTDTNSYIRYFFDTSDPSNNKLRRIDSSQAASTVVAPSLIAPLVFTAEDHQGNPVSTLHWRYVIRFILNFKEYQYPLTQVGPDYLYDYYKMEFRLTPHAPE